uniref:EF-hand domain-containing protein n=1 Tax=Caenorhabditis japonica TaxID=281687 RepID=A0A8R1EBC3_CAEJA
MSRELLDVSNTDGLTNGEFRRIYRKIMGDTKERVSIRQAYTILLKDFVNDSGYVDIAALLQETNSSKVEVMSKLLEPDEGNDEAPSPLKFRGYMTVYPKVQCICYTIDVAEPTFCEIILSLANNSDVPRDRFLNDLFLIVYNMHDELIGITRHVLSDGHYSTGMMTVNSGDKVMIFGMGTTMDRKKSTTERVVLIEENSKLSKRFRATLMNIFDSFDIDQDGVLNKNEMNFYTLACGDSELTDDDWDIYMDTFDNRDGGLTMSGFIKVHEMEALDPEGNAAADLWHSLYCLGYDTQLSAIFGCSYDIVARISRPMRIEPRLQYVVKEHRAFILESLYRLGEPDERFEMRPRLFRTDYFGLLIAKREERFANETYRMILTKREHIKINFPHQVDQLIRLADSDSDWVLIASYTVTDPDAQLEYNLEKVVERSASSATSPLA